MIFVCLWRRRVMRMKWLPMKPAPPVTRIVLSSRVRSVLMTPLRSSKAEPAEEIERLADRAEAQGDPDLRVGLGAEIESPDVDEDVDALVVVGQLRAGIKKLPVLDVVIGLELEVDVECGQPQPGEGADLVAVVEGDELRVDPRDPGVAAREPGHGQKIAGRLAVSYTH